MKAKLQMEEYGAPRLRVVEVGVEKGFAGSMVTGTPSASSTGDGTDMAVENFVW